MTSFIMVFSMCLGMGVPAFIIYLGILYTRDAEITRNNHVELMKRYEVVGAIEMMKTKSLIGNKKYFNKKRIQRRKK